jgi:hypothetical protein
MMLVTALVDPGFLSLILFPAGTRPLMKWGISFLTLGFCKICFSLISGLSSMAIVLAGSNDVDMMWFLTYYLRSWQSVLQQALGSTAELVSIILAQVNQTFFVGGIIISSFFSFTPPHPLDAPVDDRII